MMKPKIKAETDFSYTNKFIGRQIRFTPVRDGIAVTFQPQRNATATWKMMTAVPLPHARRMSIDDAFAVFRIPAGKNLQDGRRALETDSRVANMVPVLIDDEGLNRYFVPDEFTVQFRARAIKRDVERIIKQKRCQIVTRQRTPGYYTLSVPEGRGMFEMIREFSELPEVEFAEPSEIGFDLLDHIPTDVNFKAQWGLQNTGQPVGGISGTPGADIDAPNAWDITRGNPNVIIAIIDTGVDLTHPDLAPNILPRGDEDWDFRDGSDSSPDDTFGHGTRVAGVAAAVEGNSPEGAGVVGVAPQCRIMPLRITKGGAVIRLNHAADAINYVASQATANPDFRYVINLSWGGPAHIAAIHRAITNATNNNVVVVVGAGNKDKNKDGFIKQYPAVFPEVIAVAATDQNDKKAEISNVGLYVDVCAPGVNIAVADLNGSGGLVDGTSVAAPFVSGLAALIWSLDFDLSNGAVRDLIEKTCDNIDGLNPGFENLLGHGRINAFRAVSATALSVAVSPDTLELPAGSSNAQTGQAVNLNTKRASTISSHVDLAVVGTLPPGINVEFDPPSVPLGETVSKVNVIVGPNAPPGPRDLTIRGSITNPNLTKTTVLQLVVKSFTLVLSKTFVVLKGDDSEAKSADVIVTINRGPGFNASIQFVLEGLPGPTAQGAGISANINPGSTSGNTATLHLSAGRFTPEMNFVLTVRGISGNAVDTAQLVVEVLGSDVASPIGPVQP